jgi:Ger(x)C family germination protein
LLLLSMMLCGCWDQREINDMGLVVGVAFDYADINGKAGVEITVQVANPAVMAAGQGSGSGGGGAGESGAGPFWTASETGETVRSTISKFDYRIPKQLFLGHERVNIIGEKAARSGLTLFFDRLMRSRESRESKFIAVSKGDASRILEQESSIFQSTALALSDIFRDKDGRQGILAVNLADFMYRLSTGITSPVLPVVEVIPQTSVTTRESKAGVTNTVAVTGLAAFDPEARLAGYFDERESMGLLWVINRARNRVLTFNHIREGIADPISLRLVKAKSKVVVSIGDDGLPVFEIKTNAEFDLLEYFGSRQGLADVDFINELEIMAGSQMDIEIEAAIKRSQQLNTDVFGFGEEVKRKQRREWPQYKGRWREIYPLVSITHECEALIRDRELTAEAPGSSREEAGQ